MLRAKLNARSRRPAASGKMKALDSEIETHLAQADAWLRRAADGVPERTPNGSPGNDLALGRWWAQRKLDGALKSRSARPYWYRSQALPLLPRPQLEALLRRAHRELAPVFVAALDAQQARSAGAPVPPLEWVLAQVRASSQPEASAVSALLKHGHHFEVGAPWVDAFVADPITSRNGALKTPQSWVWAWACGLGTATPSDGLRLHLQTYGRVSKDARRVLLECVVGRERPRKVRAVFAELKDPDVRRVFARALAAWGTAEQVRSLFEIEPDPALRRVIAEGTRYGARDLARALKNEPERDVRLALVRSAIIDSPAEAAKIFASQPDPEVRLLLVPHLAGGAPGQLWDLLHHETINKVRQAIAEELARIGPKAFPYLILCLEDPYTPTELAAIVGLLLLEPTPDATPSSYF